MGTNVYKILTNRNALILSIIGVGLGFILRHPVELGFCVQKYTFNNYIGCFDKLPAQLSNIFITVFSVVFIFSLITHFLREDIFRAWVRFAIWWIPISVFLTLIAPDNDGNAILSPGSSREIVWLLSFALFVFISIGIIVGTYLTDKDATAGSRLMTRAMTTIVIIIVGFIALWTVASIL